ncbi:MAG TPA: DUF420 domain-containing protein [Holophagaceae bacterium]|nr:DUF420 domain-containing protein [Holophagaceae bacterium]
MTPLHTWLSAPGFLGTGAARGSDLLLLGLVALVVLVGLGLRAARRGLYRRHALFMGSASLILPLVVVIFTGWTKAGGPRGGRPVLPDLLGVHLMLATLGLAVMPVAVGLGLAALRYREGRSRGAAWPRRHRLAGYAVATLLGTTAITGILVYGWRYLIR